MKKLVFVLGLSLLGFSNHATAGTISPEGHEAVKANIINSDPKTFTINVKKFANMSVNEEAPTFAVYTKGSLPSQCGDFSKMAIQYTKPEKYHRQFDLSKNTEVLDAINQYGCVVIRNIPST